MEEESKMIDVSVLDKKAYVWDAEDACVLREEHRIVGTLVGCLPRAPRQNVHLGFPLQLLPEEATLLVEKGIGRFVSSCPILEVPSVEVVQEFYQIRKENYLQQVEAAKTQRLEAVLQHRDQILAGRKRKLEQKKEQKPVTEKEFCAETEESNTESIEESSSNFTELLPSDVEFGTLSENSALVQISVATPPPLQQQKCGNEVEWLYPQTEIEKLRYSVFKDLWEQGYYMTTGGKFGGDFLAYPGDPLRYHSFYIACCTKFHEKMDSLDISAKGRLATNVKKTFLLCSVNEQGKVCYNSLQWTGIS